MPGAGLLLLEHGPDGEVGYISDDTRRGVWGRMVQEGGRSEGRFGSTKRCLAGQGPGDVFAFALRGLVEGSKEAGDLLHETVILVGHTQEALEFMLRRRGGQLGDGLDLGGKQGDAGSEDTVAKVVELSSS